MCDGSPTRRMGTPARLLHRMFTAKSSMLRVPIRLTSHSVSTALHSGKSAQATYDFGCQVRILETLYLLT